MRFRKSHSSHFLSNAEAFAAGIKGGPVYKQNDSLIVFTCGAATTDSYTARRDYLIEYARNHFREASFFKAEDAFPVFTEGHNNDLLSIEGDLARFSDCILIVVESPGACAELGAFANDKNLVDKLLIINDSEHRECTSFISKGPISKADKLSRFKPTIYVDLPRITFVADSVCERIRNTIVRQRRKRISLSSFEAYKSISPKERLLFLLDLINLFSPIHRAEIISILKHIYGNESFEIDTYLSLLRAMNLLQVSGKDFFYRLSRDYRYSYDYTSLNLLETRSGIVNFYSKYCRDRLSILDDRAKPDA